MALQTANQYQLMPDTAGSLLGGFKAGQGIRSTIDENQRTAQYRQLAGIMTDPMASPEQKMQAQSQLSAIAPDQALALRQKITATMTQEEVADVTDMARAAVQVNAIQTPQGRLQFLKNRKQQLIHQGFPTLETDQVIEALEKGDTALAQQMIDEGMKAGQILGVLETGDAAQDGTTAGMRDFDYYQQLKRTNPQEAEEFGRERGYISKEGFELTSHLQKRLSTATDEAVMSERNSSEFLVLASEIEKADIGGGSAQGKWSEGIKDFTGNQNAVTELRQKYMGIRSSQGIKNLPPGVASDKDIELALKGFPTENAHGDQIASFLRGMAKLEDFNAKFNTFKAEYISDNGSERDMLKSWGSKTRNAVSTDSGSLPEGVNEDDIQTTMQANGMTREQVLQRLRGQ